MGYHFKGLVYLYVNVMCSKFVKWRFVAAILTRLCGLTHVCRLCLFDGMVQGLTLRCAFRVKGVTWYQINAAASFAYFAKV